MELILIIFVAAVVYAYFFPKGVKILGMPAEKIFGKEEDSESNNKNSD